MQLQILLVLAGLTTLTACSNESATADPKKSATVDAKTVNYACDNGMKIVAGYDNGTANAEKVTLTTAGKAFTLASAISASGARYTNMAGLSSDKALEWWPKGDEATLSEGPKDDKRLLNESKILATCKQVK
jgi:membrane-bound inhibitor of C-type lysozyme